MPNDEPGHEGVAEDGEGRGGPPEEGPHRPAGQFLDCLGADSAPVPRKGTPAGARGILPPPITPHHILKMPKIPIKSIIFLSTILLLIPQTQAVSAPGKLGIRLGSGYLWAPHDDEDLDGERLYSQSYPFFAEFSYGHMFRGVVGVNHFFSEEREHTEVESNDEEVQFTPKLRQYVLHLGVEANRHVAPRVRVRGGLSLGLFWRTYNPGWRDKSYWDKTRLGGMGQAGIDFRVGRKAWAGIGWRSYAVEWRREGRWLRGEFNRMRRMNVLSITVNYSP